MTDNFFDRGADPQPFGAPAPSNPAAWPKKQLRLLSAATGLCIIAFYILQVAVFSLIEALGLSGEYYDNLLFQNSVGSVISILCLFGPFLAAMLLMKSQQRRILDCFGKPFAGGLLWLAVPAGFAVCMAGNVATGWFISLAERVGVTLTAPEAAVPGDPAGIAFHIVQIAVVPALIEEFALRGVVMQPLRRYGDAFAVIASSVIFALMHGNLIQAPFALIAGIGLGYFVISTGSIWTGVIIHFLNNLFSVVISLVQSNTGQSADFAYTLTLSVSLVAGLGCVVAYRFADSRYRFRRTSLPLSTGQKAAAYAFTVPMLVAAGLIAWTTHYYVSFGG